jgi:hypothetical protein
MGDREGQQPELRILEEVPLHPPYLWQEREQWWIIHLRKQGAQLTNVVYGGEDTLPRETLGYIPRHRKWKGHYKPNLACVQTLLDHLAAGWDNQAFLSLCRELWQYAPMPDESERPLSESGFLYYLAKYLMATPPYPEMLHWFSYAIMQSDRLWYHSEFSGQI